MFSFQAMYCTRSDKLFSNKYFFFAARCGFCCFILLSLGRVIVPSSKIAINLPRTYEKLDEILRYTRIKSYVENLLMFRWVSAQWRPYLAVRV